MRQEAKTVEITDEGGVETIYLILRKLQPQATSYSYRIYKYDPDKDSYSYAGPAIRIFANVIAPALEVPIPSRFNSVKAGNTIWETI